MACSDAGTDALEACFALLQRRLQLKDIMSCFLKLPGLVLQTKQPGIAQTVALQA